VDRRPGWSWWGRVGWFLFGSALIVVSVALPALALAAGDLNAVAGWANILALPVSTLGLVFIVADRASARATARTAARRRPWMAPPLDRMVERPELGGRLVAALTAPGPAVVALTTALHGAGGFGKTRLAAWVCHRPEINRRFPGGLLWVTVGQEVRGADLAVRINDLAFALSGHRPAISDPEAAGAELGRLLNEWEPVLLVIDDVWEDAQLRPFRIGGQACTRLVTTRIPDLPPGDGPRISVDEMSVDQAQQLVADGVVGLPAEAAERLAQMAGRWPVLLNVVNGVLRRRVARGQPPAQAAEEVAERLVVEGPAAFDPARPADRSRAVAATVEASLALLDPVDQQRYLDLAIFPEDVDIPLDVLGLLWPDCRIDAFGEELVGLGLVADYRLDPPGHRLVLHDVMRAYLQTRRSSAEHSRVHRQLTDAAAALLPITDEQASVPWWLLPADAGYLWRYLPHHLRQAGQAGELAALVCDLRWVEAKTRRFDSVVAVEADLDLVDTPTTNALRQALRQAAHLLGPIEPPAALGATLASRLHGVPGLQVLVDRYRATLSRPLLEPAWPFPDQSNPDPPTNADRHIGPVNSCTFSPDGALLATAGDDGTVRLWHVADYKTQAVLSGHAGGVWSCAFSPDGALLATAGEDRVVRLWKVADGTQTTVLSGHTDGVNSCTFSPDGALLATTSQDGTARLWQVADGTQRSVLPSHTAALNKCAFSPDGALLATADNDRAVRLWNVVTGTEQAAVAHGVTVHRVWACLFSPDGDLLATADDDETVRLWNMATGVQQATLAPHYRTYVLFDCTFSPGRQAAGYRRRRRGSAAMECGHRRGAGGAIRAHQPGTQLCVLPGRRSARHSWRRRSGTGVEYAHRRRTGGAIRAHQPHVELCLLSGRRPARNDQ
jgi:NB-ARC domain/WD domain, G-beta repeat/APAF-1 helical domain